jgi:hypothetical protein
MKRATQGHARVHIDALPERVYELVSDITRMGEWSPETYRCRWLDGASGPAVGARFKGHNRRGRARWSNTLKVLVADPGREFAFRRDVLHCGVCDWRYRMEPEGAGTLLTESYEVVEPDWAVNNWFAGLMLGVEDRDDDLAQGLRTTLERIKQAADREHAASHQGRRANSLRLPLRRSPHRTSDARPRRSVSPAPRPSHNSVIPSTDRGEDPDSGAFFARPDASPDRTPPAAGASPPSRTPAESRRPSDPADQPRTR